MANGATEERAGGQRGGRLRRTPLAARGEPAVWLMGMALTICAVLIVGLVAMIFREGTRTFWPRQIDLVTLRSGEKFLGVRMVEEAFDPGPADAASIAKLRTAGVIDPASFDADGRPLRRLYRVGNRELGQQPFRWVGMFEAEKVERPQDAVLLERREWGIWLGSARAVYVQTVTPFNEEKPVPSASDVVDGKRVTREVLERSGGKVVRERRYLAEGPGAWAEFERQHPAAVERSAEIKRLTDQEIGAVNAEMEAQRLRVRESEIENQRTRAGAETGRSGWGVWSLLAVASAGSLGGAWWLTSRSGPVVRPGGTLVRRTVWLLGLILSLGAVLERPWKGGRVTDEELARIREIGAERQRELEGVYSAALQRLQKLRDEDAAYRVEFAEPNGRFAPLRQTEPDEAMLISQVVRAVPANQIAAGGKAGVYFDRWREFLLGEPREANTEGGVFPVIFGTVLLTMLLSVIVVPLGVVAALYLREYARQGVVTSFVRIAVNNLAGVPSIVYGVFGVGFFCYGLGQYFDRGPVAAASRGMWWAYAVGALLLAVGALSAAAMASPKPGEAASRRHRVWGFVAGVVWLSTAGLAAYVVATTPYFHGFHEAAAPNPVFGTRGLLWAALTLALMTLPVVIVATEEAIAAVPRTMREGSYGCGASKWQTIRRIVLPGAMPGIMTGMILAMARGAGEVAPLMLVGAVKLAPKLPLTGEFPFLHAERSFMHLGFHVYDLGFQSPDSEAARPMVWTTTLLLITVVVALNLAAISIRGKLRSRLRGTQF